MAGYPEVIVPESFLIGDVEEEDRFLYLKVFQTGNRRVVSIAVSDLDHLPVEMDDPHFDYDRLPEGISFALREFDTTLRRRRVPPTAQIELIVSDMLRDLEDENSDLRRALDESRIEVAFLRGQLHALREAAAINRSPITRAVLGVVLAVLVAVVGGVADGVSSAVAEQHMTQVAPNEKEDDLPSLSAYAARCRQVEAELRDEVEAGR